MPSFPWQAGPHHRGAGNSVRCADVFPAAAWPPARCESHPWGQVPMPALPQICYLAPVKLPHLLEPRLLLLRMEGLFLACSGWHEAR